MASNLERRMLAIEQKRVLRLNAASLTDEELSEMISPVFKGRAITEDELYAIRGLPNDQKRALTAEKLQALVIRYRQTKEGIEHAKAS